MQHSISGARSAVGTLARIVVDGYGTPIPAAAPGGHQTDLAAKRMAIVRLVLNGMTK